MNSILFEDKKPVKVISLEQLKETTVLSEFDGKLPKSRPIEHFEFIEKLTNMLETKKHPFTVSDIIVAKSESNKIKALDPKSVGNPKSWVFRRLIAKIILNGQTVSNKESNSAIAISYDTPGICVAFGQNVNICNNMSIFGNKYMTTIGKSSTVFDKMLEVLEKWISELEQIREHDLHIFNQLKNYKIDLRMGISLILGEMLKIAAKQYYGGEPFVTINDVTGIAQEFVKTYNDEDKMITGWELYNIGTNILSNSETNISNKLERIYKFGDFFVNNVLKTTKQLTN
jgi:hypothetical protein